MSDKNFSYRYRAPTAEERREVEGIKNFYEEEKTSDALTNSRKLDARVKNAAKIPSVAAGVAGTLLFGLGLSMVLEWKIYFFGVFVALAGAITAALAYSLYRCILTREKEKYRKEILRLSEEILRKNAD